jgi:predicted RNase H-like nuclease (RuvC/YqgF family)
MSLTLADIGVIALIFTAICSGAAWILNNVVMARFIVMDKALSRNFKQDEINANGLGHRIDELEDKFHKYQLQVSDQYSKKEEMKELKLEIKELENKMEGQHKEVMDTLAKLVK